MLGVNDIYRVQDFEKCCLIAMQNGTYENEKALSCGLVTKSSLQELSPKSFQSVFSCDTPTLATFQKYRGADAVKTMVANQITKLNSFFTVGRNMTNYQLKEASELIIETYAHWKIADLKLFVKMAKKGQLDKSYDRLDGAVIMEWCKIYNEMRLANSQSEKVLKIESEQLLALSSPFFSKKRVFDSSELKTRLNRLKRIDSILEDLQASLFEMKDIRFQFPVSEKGKEDIYIERQVRIFTEDDVKHILNLYIDVTNTEKATNKLFEFLNTKWEKEYQENKQLLIEQQSGVLSFKDYFSFRCKQLNKAIQNKFNSDFSFELLQRVVRENEIETPSELHRVLWSIDLEFGKIGLYKSMLMQVGLLRKQANDLYYQYALSMLKPCLENKQAPSLDMVKDMVSYNRISNKKDLKNCILIRTLYEQTGVCLLRGDEVWGFLDSI